MAYYWIVSYTNDLPPDLSFADGDDIDGLNDYMGKATCASLSNDGARKIDRLSARIDRLSATLKTACITW